MKHKIQMTIDALGPRMQPMTRAQVVEADLQKHDGRSHQGVSERRACIAGVVSFVGKNDVRSHFNLPAEKLPRTRNTRDEPGVNEGTQTLCGVARESVARKTSHKVTPSMLALAVLFFACGDDTTTPDAAQDSGNDVVAQQDASEDTALVDATEPDAQDSGPRTCDEAVAVRGGALAEPDLDELSGLVASRTQPGIYFAINDSGDPDIYAIDESGAALGRYHLDGARNRDFEDITIGPGPGGGDYVYVGDVGDNQARIGGDARDEVQVYAVPEPIVGESFATLTGVLTYRYTYETPFDVEAIAIDTDGSLVVLTKENTTARLLRAPLQEGPTQMEFVMERTIPLVTAMDFTSAGLLVRNYVDIYHFANLGDVATSYAGEFRRGLPGPEAQGEAIAWRADGSGLLTVSEGAAAPVLVYDCP